MEEIGILLLVVIALVGIGLVGWQRRRGPARTRAHALYRTLALTAVVAPLVLLGAYELMNARTVQLMGDIVPRVETARPMVALTFDDGPAADPAPILSALEASSTRATFFVIGADAEANRAACQKIAAAGHELGNHTYSHDRMVLRSYGEMQTELVRTDEVIRGCGYRGEIQFRPPNAKKFVTLPFLLSQMDRNDVLWDVEPDTYPDVAASAGQIVSYVMSTARPGSIILLHIWPESRATSREAVPGIIAGLQAKGYQFVTISELLTARGD